MTNGSEHATTQIDFDQGIDEAIATESRHSLESNNVYDEYLKLLDRSTSHDKEKLKWIANGESAANELNQSSDLQPLSNIKLPSDIFLFAPNPSKLLSRPIRRQFKKLQEWEGYVTNISNNTFHARLFDKASKHDVALEEAEFPLDDLTDDDRKLLKEGAVFNWLIGYQRFDNGGLQRVSQIIFRRIPAWTKRDFREANEYAETIENALKWE